MDYNVVNKPSYHIPDPPVEVSGANQEQQWSDQGTLQHAHLSLPQDGKISVHN